jgi:putative ABC transport system substrate-binding protein
MRRREFITLVGGAVAWPCAARAQRPTKLPTVGILGFPSGQPWTSAFVKGLRNLGWVEGSTIAIEYRWAGGRDESFGQVAAELVRLKVDVIVTAGTSNILAAMQATSLIPIVFAAAGDPIGNKLVSSLAHPGGNVTGLSLEQADIASKRVGLLREVVPNLHRLAMLINAGNPSLPLEISQVGTAVRAIGGEMIKVEIRQVDDLAPALIGLKDRADALYVAADPLVVANRALINKLALDEGVPSMHGFASNVEAGGLMSYGPDFDDLFRRAAGYVDKILHGTKPADIPVELPTKFTLAINLKTAKTLGLKIPDNLLFTADQVIE